MRLIRRKENNKSITTGTDWKRESYLFCENKDEQRRTIPKRPTDRFTGVDKKLTFPATINFVVHIIVKRHVENIIKICFGYTNSSDIPGKKITGKKNKTNEIITIEVAFKNPRNDFLSMSPL